MARLGRRLTDSQQASTDTHLGCDLQLPDPSGLLNGVKYGAFFHELAA